MIKRRKINKEEEERENFCVSVDNNKNNITKDIAISPLLMRKRYVYIDRVEIEKEIKIVNKSR